MTRAVSRRDFLTHSAVSGAAVLAAATAAPTALGALWAAPRASGQPH